MLLRVVRCCGVFCAVLCCAVLCCCVSSCCVCACLCVSLCHVSGVEQCVQVKRINGRLGNVLFSTCSQTENMKHAWVSHMVTHAGLVPVHTGSFQRVKPHTTPRPQRHTTTAITPDNDNDKDTQPTKQKHATNQPAAQFDSTRENSPGPDTGRNDRMTVLS